MTAPGSGLFVQPHFDDCALSVGGSIALAARRGESPVVATVFAREPDASSLNQIASTLHRLWGTGDDTFAVRLAEDGEAMRILGAEAVLLPFLDAIYRGDRYAAGRLRGPLHPDDGALIDEVADAIAELWERRGRPALHIPLAIGGHVDHTVVRLAGERLVDRAVPVLFFEDFPHLTVAGDLEAALAGFGDATCQPVVHDVSETIETRIEAIGAYRSQISVLFRADGPFAGDYPAMVRRFTGKLVSGGAGERFWRVSR